MTDPTVDPAFSRVDPTFSRPVFSRVDLTFSLV
jgi:hypothetical protein